MKAGTLIIVSILISLSPHPSMCAVCNGPYPASSLLRRYNNVHTPVPLFADLLLSEGRVYAVLNLKLVPSQAWHTAQWTLEKNGSAAVECATFGQDPHQHTLIFYADQTRVGVDGTTLEHITIRGRVRGMEHVIVDVPLCPHSVVLPDPVAPNPFLTACTSILSDASILNRVPEWIAYNHVQGIQHSYIYINDDFDASERALRPFVTAGLATLINWHPPDHQRSLFLYQQAQQNACLLRARGRSHWVALHDVDEFLYASKPWSSVGQLMRNLTEGRGDAGVGAVEIKNWFYGLPAQPQPTAPPSRLVMARCTGRDSGPVVRGREKLIVRPQNVLYVSVHMVTLGMPIHTLDAESEMRLVHYKDVEHRRYDVTDAVMEELVEPVQAVMDGVMMREKRQIRALTQRARARGRSGQD